MCAAALRFTKPDNRHGRGALVKERAPLLSFLGESGRKNSKEDRAKYSFRNIEDANLLKHIMKHLNGSILSQTTRYLGFFYHVYSRGFLKMWEFHSFFTSGQGCVFAKTICFCSNRRYYAKQCCISQNYEIFLRAMHFCHFP